MAVNTEQLSTLPKIEPERVESLGENKIDSGSSKHREEEEEEGEESSELPTEEELTTLRRIPGSFPWSTYLIAYAELAERFSYYGCTVVFTNFIQQPMPPGSRTGAGGSQGQSGALGMGQKASTGITTFNSMWAYVTPLIGAYYADTYFGRYKAICIAIAITLVGHILLIFAAIPPVLDNPNGALGCFIIAIIIMGAGTGGFKSNISPLIAEQQTGKLHVRTEPSGERVIVDPALTIQRIYMYFYLFINLGSLIGQISMTYSEKFVGFWLSFFLPTVVFLTVPVVLIIGRNRYVRTPPTGSVLGSALRLLRYASRGKWSLNPFTTWRNFKSPDFWEKVKPSNVNKEFEKESGKPTWMTWDDNWVEEVRRGFKACVVFAWYPLYWLSYNQIGNNLTSQAATLDTHGLPNDVLGNLNPLSLVIFIPICDLLIYPALLRAGYRFTPIKKITAGFFTASSAMIWSAVVQYYIYKTNPCGKSAATCVDADDNVLTSPMTVWVQTGSYVLIALSEIFASITGLEYAFTKAPKNMRSLVMSVFLFTNAISYALGQAFVALSGDPLLIWNYGVFAVLAFVGGTGFWFSFRHLDEQEDELNKIQEGHLEVDSPKP